MKKLSSDSRNVSTSSTTMDQETSQEINWSTPSEPSVFNTKPLKSSTSSILHPMLPRWTSEASLKSSDSTEKETLNPHWVNYLNTSTSRSKELLVHKNSKRSHNQSDKTSQLLKLIKWSTLLIRTETESSTTTSSSASSPRTIQRSERYDALFDLILSHFSCFFLLSYKMHLINDLIDLWNLWNLQMKRFWITFWALNKRNLYYEHFNFIT